MLTKIDVTQEDIDSGRRCSSTSCPIARALLRATGQSLYVWAYACGYSGNMRYDLPAIAKNKIAVYDLCGVMTPFSFELDFTE